jgi:hypothetical protein
MQAVAAAAPRRTTIPNLKFKFSPHLDKQLFI